MCSHILHSSTGVKSKHLVARESDLLEEQQRLQTLEASVSSTMEALEQVWVAGCCRERLPSCFAHEFKVWGWNHFQALGLSCGVNG